MGFGYDVSVMITACKNFIKQRFQEWYAEQIVRQKEDGSSFKPIADFPMQLMKSLGVKWIMEAYDYMLAHPDIIRNGFRATGIPS